MGNVIKNVFKLFTYLLQMFRYIEWSDTHGYQNIHIHHITLN